MLSRSVGWTETGTNFAAVLEGGENGEKFINSTAPEKGVAHAAIVGDGLRAVWEW